MNIIKQLRITAAVAACRASAALLRITGRGGTNLPGVIARKLYPDILAVTSAGVRTILVTGTNGKTTTCRIVEEALRRGGFSVLANRSGANLLGGAVTTFTQAARLSGKARHEAAVIECDEAAFALITRWVDASAAICSNLFRDQLDRYGEIGHTAEKIREGMANLEHAALCINADCALSFSTAADAAGRTLYFGAAFGSSQADSADTADCALCPVCGGILDYGKTVYGHLGHWHCAGCGCARPETYTEILEVLERTEDSSLALMRIGDREHEVRVNLPGDYNLYNAAAAITAAVAVGVEPEAAVAAAGSFEGGFGRLERIRLNDAEMRMILVKNPAGLDQALSLAAGDDTRAVAILLNDNTGDGRDVSWIWDAGLERLAESGAEKIFAAGIRADELALRLYYAGVPRDRVEVVHDYAALVDKLAQIRGRVFLLPTYSAMFDLRDELGRRTQMPDFWA